MKKLTLATLVFGFIGIAQFAHAMGDAGCGLGSVVWEQNTKLKQLFASTTNGTFGSQTFGITSGTSNCKAKGLVMLDKEQIYFAEANFQALSIEMAKGTGENLNAFAQVMGCKDGAEFGAFTKAKYETLFPSNSTTPVQMLDSLKTEMKSSSLAKNCNVSA